ncbi:hypothetical protein E2C01_032175 [Portunus trituberculatus]|uniref:Uncharacterized protein n=1 Tax=Portunus trituberculatus TaxID=210409 RepID=A0A5B7F237_PORTR|nr:hypothetical protein [Portunus trituberculatus]
MNGVYRDDPWDHASHASRNFCRASKCCWQCPWQISRLAIFFVASLASVRCRGGRPVLSGEWLCGVVALCCAEVRGGLTLLCAGAAVLTRCIGGGGVLA